MAATSPFSKYHQVALALAAHVREGRYDKAGLPSERRLMAEFGVARVTIRSALRRLEDRGLVVRPRRQSAYVAAARHGEPVRRILREHVDAFLDRGRNDKRRVLKFGFVPATGEVADALGLGVGANVLHFVRLRSDATGPLTYTESFLPEVFASAVTRAGLERRAFVQLLEKAGIRIGSAEQRAAAVGAPLAISKALGLPLHAPILKLSRLLRDERDRPLQWLVAWHRADRFELRMHLSRSDDATKVWIDYHL